MTELVEGARRAGPFDSRWTAVRKPLAAAGSQARPEVATTGGPPVGPQAKQVDERRAP